MTYFEKELPNVKIIFDNKKKFELDTLVRFTTRLDNNPKYAIRESYYFRVHGIDREFLETFKTYKVKEVQFYRSAKDENGSPISFVDTLTSPVVNIDQSLFSSGELGVFDFCVYIEIK